MNGDNKITSVGVKQGRNYGRRRPAMWGRMYLGGEEPWSPPGT